MSRERSVLAVVALPDGSLLFGFTQKGNVLHPRVVVARWDWKTYHWIDTVPNCIYGNWHVWPDGSFWIGSRNSRKGAWDTGTSFRRYTADGEVLAEWIGPYALDSFLGANNEWAVFQSHGCYSPGLKQEIVPATRVFVAKDGRFVEREWPDRWGCLTAIASPQNELWCFGSENVREEVSRSCSPNWENAELLFEDGERIACPTFGYKYSPRAKATFAGDGWFYIADWQPYFAYAAKTSAIRAKSPKWAGLLDLSETDGYEIDRPACIVSSDVKTAIIGNNDGYVELKGGKVLRSDDIIKTSRLSVGIMLPQHFAVNGGWIIQGDVKYGDNPNDGIRFIAQDSIGTDNAEWKTIDPIPDEWFTRKPKRLPKSLQRRLEFEHRNVEPK